MTSAESRNVLIAAILIGLAGGCILILMPAAVGAMVASGLDIASAGLVASIELLGMAVGSIIMTLLLSRRSFQTLALLAVGVALLGNLGSMVSTSFATYAPARFICGLGEGGLLAIMSALIATLPSPDRGFALFFAVNLSVSTVLFQALPSLTGIVGSNAPFIALLGLSIVAAMACRIVPSSQDQGRASTEEAPTIKINFKAVGLGLLGTLLFFVSIGSLWPFAAQIGQANGLDEGAVANALSTSTFFGIFIGLAVSFFGHFIPRWIAILIGSVLLCAILSTFAASLGGFQFLLLCAAFMTMWVFCTPYYMGQMAVFDPSGKVVAFSLATQFAGLMIGPLITPSLISGGSFAPAAFTSATICVLAMLVMLAGVALAGKSEPQAEAI